MPEKNPVTTLFYWLKNMYRYKDTSEFPEECKVIANIVYLDISESDNNCCLNMNSIINSMGLNIFRLPTHMMAKFIKEESKNKTFNYIRKRKVDTDDKLNGIYAKIGKKYFASLEESKQIYEMNKENLIFKSVFDLK
jgi:hypothetical protein